VFGLVWFRNRGVDIPQLGAGFGLSRATSYRYHREVLAVLSAQAPDLTEALQRVEADGWSHVILDGKVVDSNRCAQKTISKKGEPIDAWYSGKTHDFGGNFQAVMRPDGFPVWVSDVEPGPWRSRPGRHLQLEAGRGHDRCAEGDRPFVDQPQQNGELQSLLHADCLSPCSANRKRLSQPTRRARGLHPIIGPHVDHDARPVALPNEVIRRMQPRRDPVRPAQPERLRRDPDHVPVPSSGSCFGLDEVGSIRKLVSVDLVSGDRRLGPVVRWPARAFWVARE
jgi:hypothetical protein